MSYKIFVVLLMFLMHYIEDFHVQGCLANLKQKTWWIKECKKENVDSKKYKDDFKMSLFAHSFENAIFVMLPMTIDMLISEHFKTLSNTWFLFIPAIIFLTSSHYLIDDAKANKLKINLVQDQLAHIACILLIAILYFPAVGAWR